MKSKPQDLLLRGSLITLSRRCGNPACRCAKGELHQTPALSWSVMGKTKMLTLREQDLPVVQQALARYKKALADLDQQAMEGIATLREQIAWEKRGGRQ
jgi:hypothetical protein